MNEEVWKKGFLLLVCAIVILAYMTVDNDPTIEVKAKDGTALNQSTCTNALNLLKSAKFQQRMLDQQVLLSTAAGRTADAATVAAQAGELMVVITVLKKLIADPKLDCGVYLENTANK